MRQSLRSRQGRTGGLFAVGRDASRLRNESAGPSVTSTELSKRFLVARVGVPGCLTRVGEEYAVVEDSLGVGQMRADESRWDDLRKMPAETENISSLEPCTEPEAHGRFSRW